ncbi:MAG: hypothetical protein K0U66_08875 [Gammaproteobacteria bacterium]|nr:hypothetical protein [Gammaproteobacteria bacterium]
MNINSTIASVLMIIGISATPTSFGGGIFWVLVVYLFALGSCAGNPKTRWDFKRARWIAMISFSMGSFGAVAHLAVQDWIPVEGAMGLAGAIYPLYITMPKELTQFFKGLIERKVGK